jgi:hypothetical protein
MVRASFTACISSHLFGVVNVDVALVRMLSLDGVVKPRRVDRSVGADVVAPPVVADSGLGLLSPG